MGLKNNRGYMDMEILFDVVQEGSEKKNRDAHGILTKKAHIQEGQWRLAIHPMDCLMPSLLVRELQKSFVLVFNHRLTVDRPMTISLQGLCVTYVWFMNPSS